MRLDSRSTVWHVKIIILTYFYFLMWYQDTRRSQYYSLPQSLPQCWNWGKRERCVYIHHRIRPLPLQKSAIMGFHSSNDTYTKKFNDITVDVKWSNHCVDDTLLWDDSIEASFWHVLTQCDWGWKVVLPAYLTTAVRKGLVHIDTEIM